MFLPGLFKIITIHHYLLVGINKLCYKGRSKLFIKKYREVGINKYNLNKY